MATSIHGRLCAIADVQARHLPQPITVDVLADAVIREATRQGIPASLEEASNAVLANRVAAEKRRDREVTERGLARRLGTRPSTASVRLPASAELLTLEDARAMSARAYLEYLQEHAGDRPPDWFCPHDVRCQTVKACTRRLVVKQREA